MQLLGYNGQLYSSEAAALKSPAGGVGVAVLAQVGEKTNPELENIIKAASTLKYAGEIISILLHHIDIPYTGSSTSLTSVSLSSLVPSTSQMITYEGSLTQPGCQVYTEKMTTYLRSNHTFNCPGICDLDHPQQANLRAGRAHGAAEDPDARDC